jgi:hypothetical protein
LHHFREKARSGFSEPAACTGLLLRQIAMISASVTSCAVIDAHGTFMRSGELIGTTLNRAFLTGHSCRSPAATGCRQFES